MMFKSYASPLPIHWRLYEISLGIFRSDDFSKAPRLGVEHDARYVTRLHNETLREDSLEFNKNRTETREPTKHKLRVEKRVSAFERGDITDVKSIDAYD